MNERRLPSSAEVEDLKKKMNAAEQMLREGIAKYAESKNKMSQFWCEASKKKNAVHAAHDHRKKELKEEREKESCDVDETFRDPRSTLSAEVKRKNAEEERKRVEDKYKLELECLENWNFLESTNWDFFDAIRNENFEANAHHRDHLHSLMMTLRSSFFQSPTQVVKKIVDFLKTSETKRISFLEEELARLAFLRSSYSDWKKRARVGNIFVKFIQPRFQFFIFHSEKTLELLKFNQKELDKIRISLEEFLKPKEVPIAPVEENQLTSNDLLESAAGDEVVPESNTGNGGEVINVETEAGNSEVLDNSFGQEKRSATSSSAGEPEKKRQKVEKPRFVPTENEVEKDLNEKNLGSSTGSPRNDSDYEGLPEPVDELSRKVSKIEEEVDNPALPVASPRESVNPTSERKDESSKLEDIETVFQDYLRQKEEYINCKNRLLNKTELEIKDSVKENARKLEEIAKKLEIGCSQKEVGVSADSTRPRDKSIWLELESVAEDLQKVAKKGFKWQQIADENV